MRRRSEDSAADTLRLAFLIQREVAATEIPARGMMVLNFLGQHPEGEATFAEVREECRMSPSHTTEVCDGLIEKGLVARASLPKDGRVSILKLTARGRTVIGDFEKRITSATHSSP